MPVDDIKPSEPMRPYVGNEQGQSKNKPGYGGYQGKRKFPSSKRNVNDVTTFMGIPQEELTPAVSDAIISLMEELEELRSELSHTHSLENMLTDNMDKHPDLPVLTRHALGREIAIMCAHVARTQSHSSFVYFQIQNSLDIKRRSGLLAFESVMREVAEILKGQLRETDRIGTLGGDGFGIVLALSDTQQALDKVKKLEELSVQGPLMHEGHIIDVKVAYGIHALHAGEDVLAVLHGADQDLHKRFVVT
jgi:diguanylate cyclase (GGDEF)-like protein